MSLKSLLQAGIQNLFGGAVNAQSSSSGYQVRGEEITVIMETIKKMKDMTQIFLTIQHACHDTRSEIGMDLPQPDKLERDTIHASELTLNNLLRNVGMIQKWENVEINDAIAAKVNPELFKDFAVSITAAYSKQLAQCAQHLDLYNELSRLFPVEDGEKIKKALQNVMDESPEWSLKLQNIIFRGYNFGVAAPSEQMQPS